MNNQLRNYTKKNLSNQGFLSNLSVTWWIIIVNVILFIGIYFLLIFNPDFQNYIALQPNNFFSGKYIWTLITSMFMHANFAHLFFNMFSLYFIGSFVEKIVGRKRFFWFYLVSGIFAGLFFASLSWFFGMSGIGEKIFGNPSIAGVGASGAIFGLLGLLAVIVPRAKVYLIIGPLIAIIFQFTLSMFITNVGVLNVLNILLNIYVIVCIFAIFSFNSQANKIALPVEITFWLLPFIAIVPLVIIGLFVELPIGNMAHLGGLIAGLVYGAYLRTKYSNKIKMLNKMIIRK